MALPAHMLCNWQEPNTSGSSLFLVEFCRIYRNMLHFRSVVCLFGAIFDTKTKHVHIKRTSKCFEHPLPGDGLLSIVLLLCLRRFVLFDACPGMQYWYLSLCDWGARVVGARCEVHIYYGF